MATRIDGGSLKTLAGIVAYHPDVKRLEENLSAIAPQVDAVVVFVNGVDSVAAVQKAAATFETVSLLINDKNAGVSVGLSRIMEYAIQNTFDWVLSIDQDSVCRPGLIECYKSYVNLPNVGILTCCITDRNFSEDSGFDKNDKYCQIGGCITAGSFTNVKAYRESDGYDEVMFIDGVDWDICYNLRRHGYCLYRINFDGVLHEVGHGKNVSLFGKKVVALGESPLRNYYMARNNVYLARKYPEFLKMPNTLLHELGVEVIILLYEDQKGVKIKNRWRGVKDGFSMPLYDAGSSH